MFHFDFEFNFEIIETIYFAAAAAVQLFVHLKLVFYYLLVSVMAHHSPVDN